MAKRKKRTATILSYVFKCDECGTDIAVSADEILMGAYSEPCDSCGSTHSTVWAFVECPTCKANHEATLLSN